MTATPQNEIELIVDAIGLNKIKGLPFVTQEIVKKVNEVLA